MFKLSEIIGWRKAKPPHRLAINAARAEIAFYLSGLGLNANEFMTGVRVFYEGAQIHYYRLAFRDAIAACLGLDMAKREGRSELWERMAEERVISRKTAGRWYSGESDPPLDKLMIYFSTLRVDCQWPHVERIEAVRTGIARTLTYIRVFPPQKPASKFNRNPDKVLTECWTMLRRHEYYWNEHRHDLNQDAVDQVGFNFNKALWIDADEIGEVKRQFEENPTQADPWFWPCVIFKYATFADIPSTSKRKTNPDGWIWDPADLRYHDVWRI